MKFKQYNIENSFLIIVSVFLLSACSGGGSNSEIKNQKDVVRCDTNTITILKKGDKVTALTDDTEVRVKHLEDSSKSACVLKGEAVVNSIL